MFPSGTPTRNSIRWSTDALVPALSQIPRNHVPGTSERGAPFTTADCPDGGACNRSGRAGLQDASAHASACLSFALANKGHDMRALQAYLGHKNIQHTVRYTELSPDRFKDFWR